MADNPHTGSSFDDFLKEEDLYEECTAAAIKRVLAWQLEQEMLSRYEQEATITEKNYSPSKYLLDERQ